MKEILTDPILAKISTDKYKVEITWRNGIIIADEPENIGGKDRGPDPFTLLLSSLAACTLSTLRMYIDHKQWQINSINVAVNLSQEKETEFITYFSREITFSEDINEEQRERLLNVAKKCPVSKILENKITLNTSI